MTLRAIALDRRRLLLRLRLGIAALLAPRALFSPTARLFTAALITDIRAFTRSPISHFWLLLYSVPLPRRVWR